MSANLNHAIATLDTLRPLVRVLPVAGQYLEGVFESLSLVCQHAKDVKTNKDDVAALAERAVRCVSIIVAKAQKMPEAQISSSMGTIRELGALTEELVQKAEKQARRSHLSRTWRKSGDKEVIDSLNKRFGEVIERFNIEAQLLVAYGNEDILNQVKKLVDGKERTEQDALLEKLRPVATARHDHHKAPRGCTENTRVGVINHIIRWIFDLTTLKNIFWLSGLAGTGKTTIMKTLSERLAELRALGGSFFVSVTSANRRDPINIIHTLAFQLARLQTVLYGPICNVLRNRPDIVDQTMASQISAFFLDPFAQVFEQINGPIVILIDALDECDKVDGIEGGEFLPVLLSVMHRHPGKLKLVVTSRLSPILQRLFDRAAVDCFLLHEIEKETVNGDLRLYLEEEFTQITRIRGRENEPRWYTPDDITEIITQAGSLFIYVFTVIKWVSSLQFLPEDRLRQVLRWRRDIGSRSPFEAIDDLYRAMLQNALGPDSRDHDEVGRRIHKLLEVLVTAFEPLSIPGLAQILRCHENVIRLDLENLSAVTPVPERGSFEPVVIYHASFLDYLTDKNRCAPESLFHVSVGQSHGRMGTYCLDLVYDRRYSNLENNITDCTGQNGFIYASDKWRKHFEWSAHSPNFVDPAIQKIRQVASRRHEDTQILDDLSYLLFVLSNRTNQIDILHKKIIVDRRMINLMPTSHPQKASSLINLALGLRRLYERNRDGQVLSESVRLNRDALELCPPGHPNRSKSLVNLAVGLQRLYEHNGDEEALHENIKLNREALELCPPGHPNRDLSLDNLAVGLQSLYRRNGDKQALNESVDLNREALELNPPGYPFRDRLLNNLAVGLRLLYLLSRDEHTLNENIELNREALQLRPPGHPLRDMSLTNLANGLQHLYERNGDEQALTENIKLNREAFELCPPGHSLRDSSLNNLTIGLQRLYERNGDEQTLNESVKLNREALELRPPGHPLRDTSLINLAVALRCSFERNGDQAFLNEAVMMNREALKLCPSGHPLHYMSLDGLASSLNQLYKQSGDIAVIEEAVQLGRYILSLFPSRDPARLYYMHSLSNSLKVYGEATRNEVLVCESEQLSKEAAELFFIHV